METIKKEHSSFLCSYFQRPLLPYPISKGNRDKCNCLHLGQPEGPPLKVSRLRFYKETKKKPNRNTSYFHSMQSDCQSFLNSPLLTFVSTFLWVSTGRSVLLSPNLFIMAYKCNEYHLGNIDTMIHLSYSCLSVKDIHVPKRSLNISPI